METPGFLYCPSNIFILPFGTRFPLTIRLFRSPNFRKIDDSIAQIIVRIIKCLIETITFETKFV